MRSGIIRGQRVTGDKIIASRNYRSAMTDAERIIWELVRNRKFRNLKFRRQQIVDGFIVDFYCEELRLCLEIDGGVHNDAAQREYDRERDAVLTARGVRIVRLTNDEVRPDGAWLRGKLDDLIPPAPFSRGEKGEY